MLTLRQLLGLVPLDELDAFEDLLRTFVQDRGGFVSKLEASALPSTPSVADPKSLWAMGWVGSQHLMMSLMKYKACVNGVREATFRLILQNAEEAGVITRSGLSSSVEIQINENMVKELDGRGLLRIALVNRLDYVVEASRASVCAVEVDKDDVPRLGTGFAAATVRDGKLHAALVTAAHNIRSSDGVVLRRVRFTHGPELSASDLHWVIHEKSDIAASWLPANLARPLWPAPLVPLLGETISLGYPHVPTTTESTLLAHRGEINATVTSYLQSGEHHVISNAVAPGNSGSPVLLRSGLLAGMVVSAFEGEHEGGRFAMQAALSAAEIVSFLSTLSLRKT